MKTRSARSTRSSKMRLLLLTSAASTSGLPNACTCSQVIDLWHYVRRALRVAEAEHDVDIKEPSTQHFFQNSREHISDIIVQLNFEQNRPVHISKCINGERATIQYSGCQLVVMDEHHKRNVLVNIPQTTVMTHQTLCAQTWESVISSANDVLTVKHTKMLYSALKQLVLHYLQT